VCREIEKTINQTVQNALNSLGRDCEKITKITNEKLAADDIAVKYNRKSTSRGDDYARYVIKCINL
jgi:hypothetical protein